MAVVGYFPSTLAVDSNTGTRLRNAEAQVYAIADTSFSSPLAITDVAGVPFTGNKLRSNSDGIFPEFKPPSGVTQVIVKSGQALTPMTSVAVSAQAAEDAAAAAATAAGTASSAAGTATGAASTATTAAAQAVAVGNSNDTIIEGRIKDPASKTAQALTATIDAAVGNQMRGTATTSARIGRFTFDLGTSARRVAAFEPSRLFMILRAPADQGMQVALGFPDSTNNPGAGYELIAAGQEVLIQDTRPVWAYLATSAGSVVINKQMGA